MSRRGEELRRAHRRIFGWSICAAVVLHVGVFWLSPQFEVVLPDGSRPRTFVPGEDVAELRLIDVTFGPPMILLAGGLERQEPPDRVLEAREVDISGIPREVGCEGLRPGDLHGRRAVIRLRVGPDGRTRQPAVAEGSGDSCVDRVLVAVAGTLWYRWLPDAGAPAPVDLLQPMEVGRSM